MNPFEKIRRTLTALWRKTAVNPPAPSIALRATDLPVQLSGIEKMILESAEEKGIDRALCWRLMDRLLYCVYDGLAHLHGNRSSDIHIDFAGGTIPMSEALSAADPKIWLHCIEIQLDILKLEINKGVPEERLLEKFIQKRLRDERVGELEKQEPRKLEPSVPIDI